MPHIYIVSYIEKGACGEEEECWVESNVVYTEKEARDLAYRYGGVWKKEEISINEMEEE